MIISDGGDNKSRNRLDDIIKRADRAGVLMYTVGLFDEQSEDKNPGVLRKLARQTGGLTYLPRDLASVPDICSQIAHDIRNQYTIAITRVKLRQILHTTRSKYPRSILMAANCESDRGRASLA